MKNFLTIFLLSFLICACGQSTGRQAENAEGACGSNSPTRGIYHWKTTFDFTSADSLFMESHDIGRLYVRMFDITPDNPEMKYELGVIPAGTTRFESELPGNCEIVPTVYITLSALRRIEGQEEALAELIVRRIMAMCSYNDFPEIHEVQYDCDWTGGTADSYRRLCECTRQLLAADGILLSGTIRLHQIEEAYYPFDRGVLMIYNTDNFLLPETGNSIINPETVELYLSGRRVRKFIAARKENCPIIDIAYPAYGWGVLFKDGIFDRLISGYKDYELQPGEELRVEESSADLVLEAKNIVEEKIGSVCSGNIIYHLDQDNLKDYSDDEIESFLR